MYSESEPITTRRNKTIAILLAVFFGPFAWLYTYHKNAWKAAVGIAIVIGVFLQSAIYSMGNIIFYPYSETSQLISILKFVSLTYFCIFCLPIWIWSIIDNAISDHWHSAGPEVRRKRTALLLSIFLGPWTWFYTYKIDKWKFWAGIIFGAIVFSLNMLVYTSRGQFPYYMPGYDIWRFLPLIIYILAIINASLRKKEWYKDFGLNIPKLKQNFESN